MNRQSSHIEIRRLIEDWYAGILDRNGETRLYELLDNEACLPDDLERERRLINALRDAADSETEIPAEQAYRINTALEKEMAADRVAAASRASRARHRIRLSWAAAAILLLAVGAPLLLRLDKTPERLAEVPRPVMAPDAPISDYSTESAAREDTLSLSVPDIPRENMAHARKPHKSRKHSAPSSTIKRTDPEMPYEYDETETRLMASNYHVVTDPMEADALLSSIFGRLESRMCAESVKMEEISDDYQIEMTKLSVAGSIN